MTKQLSLTRKCKRLSFLLMCLFVLRAMGYMTEGQKMLITCFSIFVFSLVDNGRTTRSLARRVAGFQWTDRLTDKTDRQ